MHQNTVCDTERQTNVIINIKCAACSDVLCPVNNVNRFVSVNYSVQRKRSNGNMVFICFMCLIDTDKFFEKHL